MGMTKNQLELIEYVARNDLKKAKQAALACCAEDTTQKNHREIRYCENLLNSKGLNMVELPVKISAFCTMEDLSMTFLENRYYLTKEEENLFTLIKNMHTVSLQLMEKHIPYVNATLLYGESGVGKTEFSRYVAYKMNMPYLYVNFSRMVDSYLGNTAKNIAALFDFLAENKCVVMLDELDSIAVKRKYAEGSAGNELARSTTCLLQMLDSVNNEHIIIGATNLIDEIDPAVRRRFTEKHEIHRLREDDIYKFIVQFLEDAGYPYDDGCIKEYAKEKHSQAEIMTHVTRCIAEMLILNEKEVII